MAATDRRRFLLHSAGAGLAAAAGVPLLGGCWGEEVYTPTDTYDAIVVGGGAAGAIVAAKLAQAGAGAKRILVVEAGGPTTASLGGTAYPAWAPPGRRDLTIFDVPGSYSQLAWTPLAAPYQLAETAFTYQGIGLGGNGVFNGMLFQTNPPGIFARHWPAGWQWADLAPHFDRVRQRMPVTNTPSTDGVAQNTGPADIVHPLYAAQGWTPADTSRPFGAQGAYSRPYVVTQNGRRAGPISGYFEAVAPGGVPVAGLEILTYAKAARIDFDGKGNALAVRYDRRPGLDQSLPAVAGAARLRPGGIVVLAAGALMTPRLLLQSGVGPRGREREIFPGQDRAPFAIDNPRIGTGLDQSLPAVAGAARLRPGGIVVLAAGALMTPRLLLLSGVGPRGREQEIFPGQSRAPFAIDNPRIGTGLFDHVLTMLAYDYAGPTPYRAYDYSDYAANAADLARYLANGSGPYAQYQPVSILNVRAGSDTPDVEVFLNPNGAGTPGGPYWTPRTFCAFVMLLDPKARGVLAIDAKDHVGHPPIYLPDTADGHADTALMTQAVFDLIALFARDPALRIVFGPGSASHPDLRPNVLADVRQYVTGPSPVDNVHFNRLVTNHWGGTAPLTDGPGGVDPATLVVRGTGNVAVVDASLLPSSVAAHPVGTIMAVADRAADILARRWA